MMKEPIFDPTILNLIESISSGVAVYAVRNDGATARDYILLFLNRVALELVGKKSSELIGRVLDELSPGIDAYGLIPVFREVWKTGEPGFLPAREYRDQYFSGCFENRVFRLVPDKVVVVFDEVTEHILARKALVETESLLIEIVNSIDKAIAIYEPVDGGDDFRFIFMNEFGERLTHFRIQDVIGKRISALFPGESSVGLIANLKETLRTGRTVSIPLKEYRDDRITQWVENTLVRLPSGKVAAIFEDTHERREAENTLRRSEERYRLAETIGNVGNWEYNLETQEFWGSEQTKRIYGFDLNDDSFTTEEVESCIPERERVHRALVDLIEKAKPYNLEFDINPKGSKSTRTITSIARLIQESPDRPLKVVGIIQDITGRKRAEEALSKSEQEYIYLFNSIRDAILVTDANRVIVNCNQSFTDLFGYSKEEILGKSTKYLYADSSEYGSIGDILEHHTDDPSDILLTIQYRKKNGQTFPGETSIYQIRSGDVSHSGKIGLIRDVSERESLVEQMRQSQKMEAVGQLAGGIAHDFNNLLTIINGYSEILIHGGNLPGKEFEEVSQIRQAGERAAALTGQLLAFSRKQMLEPEVVNLNDLIENTRKMLMRIIGEDISLTTLPSALPAMIKVDPGQLEQIIMNLAVNSRDAMPTGGDLVIETKIVGRDDAPAELANKLTGASVIQMSVFDNGHGMDASTLERIFEPFFTTKDSGKGTGMGLSTVYGIVKQSGGEIHVTSDPGRGTEFSIYFPLASSSTLAFRTDHEGYTDLTGTETILVVEDEGSVMEFIELVLIHYGYDVVTANSALEAQEILRTQERPVHLLLTDVIMPLISGRELADIVLEDHPGIRICFMSGYTDDAIVHHGVSDRALNFIHKPFSPKNLVKKIRSVLDES